MLYINFHIIHRLLVIDLKFLVNTTNFYIRCISQQLICYQNTFRKVTFKKSEGCAIFHIKLTNRVGKMLDFFAIITCVSFHTCTHV